MYTAVLMVAMVTSTESIDFGGRGGGGGGCCGTNFSGYNGGRGGCAGGGYHGGCSGYHGGGYHGGCSGYHGGYHGGGCQGGCTGGSYRGAYGGGGYYSGYYSPVLPAQPAFTGNTPATIVVSLPADARLIVDGHTTTSTGARRTLVTPPLDNGGTYAYTLRAEFNANGQTRIETRDVTVRSGQTSVVDFNTTTQGVARP